MARRKRRTFSAEFKFETVIEALRGEKSAAQICRERDISENLLSYWKNEFLERSAEVFENARGGKTDAALPRIAQLEQLAGRQALELEILKKGWQLAEVGLEAKREMIQQMTSEHPVKRLCEVLDCPRSSYYYKAQPASDGPLKAEIESIYFTLVLVCPVFRPHYTWGAGVKPHIKCATTPDKPS